MLIRAANILCGPELTPLPHAAVRVAGHRIEAIGSQDQLLPLTNETVIDLPDCVLMPGLINAHTHLDYTLMAGMLPPGRGKFSDWMREINATRQQYESKDYIRAVEHGFELLLQNGITTAANIAALPEIIPQLIHRSPLRIWWFLELVDVRTRLQADTALQAALDFFDTMEATFARGGKESFGGFGLSPHAPYTASVDLYRLTMRCAERLQAPITTHLAESMEESEMFLQAAGPLHELCASLGRDNSDCGYGSSVSHLAEQAAFPPNCLAVHLNYLQEYDWPLLRRANVTAVHCPRSHAFFEHARFPMERMRTEGIPVCLGTDSLASNHALDLRGEIRLAQKNYPTISPLEWLQMVTTVPARALNQDCRLGEISVNAYADLVAFPLSKKAFASSNAHDTYQAIIDSNAPPAWMAINGNNCKSQ